MGDVIPTAFAVIFFIMFCSIAYALFVNRRRRFYTVSSGLPLRDPVEVAMRRMTFTGAHAKKVRKLDSVLTEEQLEQSFPVTLACREESCVICLCEIEMGDLSRELQCQHNFHADCIRYWFMHKPWNKPKCPTCRRVQRLARPRDEADRKSRKHQFACESIHVGEHETSV
mmetsp:Transcript_100635/g.189791  ORF Transcript_100635/g.189791 Transcript_100635/m.189791 type:complete len:170 (-) Transcript_100635:155-664(-)